MYDLSGISSNFVELCFVTVPYQGRHCFQQNSCYFIRCILAKIHFLAEKSEKLLHSKSFSHFISKNVSMLDVICARRLA